MKREFYELHKRLGRWHEVAVVLGVSERQIYRLKKQSRLSKPMQKLITLTLQQIKLKESLG